MTDTLSPLTLCSLGVVILADSHNPTILNPDFAVSKMIAPTEWKVIRAITTPGFAVLTFDNGVDLTVDPNRLNITQTCGDRPFQDLYASKIHAVADAYVRTLPHTPYRGLGLNYAASIDRDRPLEWITKMFLKPGSHHDNLQMLPRFIIKRDDSTLRIGFNYDGDSKQERVLIDCNVHYDGPLDAKALCRKIDEWAAHKEYINAVICDLIQDDQSC